MSCYSLTVIRTSYLIYSANCFLISAVVKKVRYCDLLKPNKALRQFYQFFDSRWRQVAQAQLCILFQSVPLPASNEAFRRTYFFVLLSAITLPFSKSQRGKGAPFLFFPLYSTFLQVQVPPSLKVKAALYDFASIICRVKYFMLFQLDLMRIIHGTLVPANYAR